MRTEALHLCKMRTEALHIHLCKMRTEALHL